MASDWEWFFSSEWGRDKILRDELEGVAAASASAHAQNARLTSRLTQLQGSLESRLNALSAAFDAYVELGDVREQLAAYGDVAVVRREAIAAVEALAAGGRPEPLRTEAAPDYWLPYAVNAVIALVAGQPDAETEQDARERSRVADLFVVVLTGGLGRGELVADRVPDLLVGDGALRPPQVTVWQAVLAGLYPDREAVLDAVERRWRAVLAGGEPGEWADWVGEQAQAPDAVGELEWVRAVLDGGPLRPRGRAGEPPAEEAVRPGVYLDHVEPAHAADAHPDEAFAAPDPRRPLQGLASVLIAEGSDDERGLIARARALRQRIEHPGTPVTATGEDAEVRTAVRTLVRDTLAQTADPALRTRLLGWIRPGLGQAVGTIVATPVPVPAPVEVRTPGGQLVVGPAGPDARRLAKVRENVVAAHPGPGRALTAWGVLAGVAALSAVVAGLGGATGWAVFAVLGVLAGLVGVGKAVYDRTVARRETAVDAETTERAIGQGQDRAVQAKATYDRHLAAIDQLSRELRTRLEQPVPVGGETVR